MQSVFLNVAGARERGVHAYFDATNRSWYFDLPGNGRATEDEALQYMQGFKRYGLRDDARATLMTHAVVFGDAVLMPWDAFKDELVKNLDDLAWLDPPPGVVCSVCYEEFMETASLRQMRQRSDTLLVASPCGREEHAVCASCLKRVVLNFYSHPVTPTKRTLGCLHDDCGGGAYDLDDFHWLLTDDEFSQLLEHLRKVYTPEFLSVQCAGCPAVLQVENTPSRANRPVALGCTSCSVVTCWQCMSARDYCMCAHGGYGGAFNRFYRPSPGNKCALLRNYELTHTGCLSYLERILLDQPRQTLNMECPCCHALVQKSTECNEMSHCGRKWCYLCGEMCLQNETFMCDHFGDFDCPRYEEVLFWKAGMGCDMYECMEGGCYDDAYDCTVDSHARGRAQKNVRHRQRWFDATLTSTPFRLRNGLLSALKEKYLHHPLL